MRGRSLTCPEFETCVGLCPWVLDFTASPGFWLSRTLNLAQIFVLFRVRLDFWLPDSLLLILSIGPGQGSGAWEGEHPRDFFSPFLDHERWSLLIDAFESKNAPWRRSKADLGDSMDYQKV